MVVTLVFHPPSLGILKCEVSSLCLCLDLRTASEVDRKSQGDYHECSWSLLCMVYHISNAEHPQICSFILRTFT